MNEPTPDSVTGRQEQRPTLHIGLRAVLFMLAGAVVGLVVGFAGVLGFLGLCADYFFKAGEGDGMIAFYTGPLGAIIGGVTGLLGGLRRRGAWAWGLGALVGLGPGALLFLMDARQQSNVSGFFALLMPVLFGLLGRGAQEFIAGRRKSQPSQSPTDVVAEYEEWKHAHPTPEDPRDPMPPAN
jgi:hypothetical protein